jgi:hypothetical protein
MINIKPVLLTGALLFAIFVAVLAIVQFATPGLAGNDGYYHIKLAEVMRQQGLTPTFVWLPLTILSADAFYDHHFLYHVLLIPFTLMDLTEGAKWASVIFPALTFLTGWTLLRGQRVPFAALWAVGFVAISSAFLYRMSMPRVQALSLLVILLALHLALTRRYRWLAPLGFLYVWLYDAFPLIIVAVGVYSAMRLFIDRRFEVAPLAYTGLGVVLGLIINPYFPENLVFIYHHLAPKLADATATKVGNEWYPYRTWTLVQNSTGALLAFVAGIFALGLSERRMNVATATLLTLSVLFGMMLFKSRRFVEYFPAFALLFCAVAWTPLLKQWTKNNVWVNRAVPVILIALLLPGIWWTVQNTQDNLQSSKPADLYADASAWLRQNTPAGSRVFQTDWDDFTRLFHYNTHNTYIVGLDPTYLQLFDEDLYDVWVDITRGKVEDPSAAIETRFGASYVISDLKHKKFINQAENDPRLVEQYRDDEAIIFQITAPAAEELGGG